MAKKPLPKNGAKKKQPAMPAEDSQTVKEPSKLQKLFVWVLIPVLFALAMGMIVAEVTGTNVFEKAKSLVGSSEETASKGVDQQSVDAYNKQIVDLKAQLTEREALTDKLQTEIDNNKTDAAKAEVEKKRLEKEIKKLQEAKTDTKTDTTTLVKTYEQMSPKAAAAVISAMSDDEAIKILKNLKPATLAPILEKMTPEKAATLSESLSKGKK